MLALVAGKLGVSMNELVEDAVIDKIERTGAALAEDYAHTLGLLAAYRGDHSTEIRRVVDAETRYPDPTTARMVREAAGSPDVAEVFATAANAAHAGRVR